MEAGDFFAIPQAAEKTINVATSGSGWLHLAPPLLPDISIKNVSGGPLRISCYGEQKQPAFNSVSNNDPRTTIC